jgi:hypothetical protein
MVFAAKPRIIADSKGEEREARVLSAAPFVQAGEREVARITGLQRSRPREFIPSDA